jgi:hypothetical protein
MYLRALLDRSTSGFLLSFFVKVLSQEPNFLSRVSVKSSLWLSVLKCREVKRNPRKKNIRIMSKVTWLPGGQGILPRNLRRVRPDKERMEIKDSTMRIGCHSKSATTIPKMKATASQGN